MSVFLELPLFVVHWAHLPGLQPPRDAVEVVRVVTRTPCHCALFSWVLRLATDAGTHDVVPADGAVVTLEIPGPLRYCFPPFWFKSYLWRFRW